MTLKQLKYWGAAMTLILFILMAALHFVLSPVPPKKSVPAPKPRAIQTMPEPSRGERVFIMEATAYCYGTKTFTGTTPVEGRTVATDPSIIPLHSHLTINGVPGYVAEDVGKDIQNYRIDLFLSDRQRCLNFGRQMVRVKVKE